MHHLKYEPSKEEPIRRWISYVARLIEPKERFTYFSKGFWKRIPKECIPAVLLLADKFEHGENVNPYQSTTLKSHNFSERKGLRTDLLWADWNIHHFHLSTSTFPEDNGFYSRSDYLLFAIVRDNYVCFLDVKLHKNKDCFSDPLFIRQIVESWPKLAEQHMINGIHPKEGFDANEIKSLRKNGVIPLASFNGNVYMMGKGISTAGTSGEDIFLFDTLLFEIELLAKGLIDFWEKRKIQSNPNSISLIIKDDGLNLICTDDGSFSNIRSHPLEQTNRFFNQLWLLNPSFQLGAK